jgi:cell division protein ZapE
VTLVATSNVPPDQLYRDGLQRQRFVPAIRLLEAHTEIVHVGGPTDYRLRLLERAEIYHCPLDEAADRGLERCFGEIAPERGVRDARIEVAGRTLRARERADGVVWFDFAELCGAARSQDDYIEIAREYQTVIVSGIPELGAEGDDAARRLIALVDELYDRNVKLIVSAAVPPERLYAGRRLAFEFQRTRSRLREMQSREYLGKPHLP